MRVGHLQVTRPEWYDRNPAATVASMAAVLAGATASTIQATITIPSGKKAYIDFGQIEAYRTVVNTIAGQLITLFGYNQGAGKVSLVRVHSAEPAVGAMGSESVGQAGVALPGDVLTLVTFTDFGDGTVTVNGTIKITTFDA